MPRKMRFQQKQPPQGRDTMDSKKPKKTLSEEMADRLKQISEARREKVAAEKLEQYRKQEDATMEQCYGPHWRTRYPGEPMPDDEVKKAS